MRAWPGTPIPTLPGRGRALRLHDTSTGTVRPTEPGPEARMYVCGITPYDATHMGHAATYVAFDLIGRVWRDAGHSVRYVQNVTDIDDPLLTRAVERGEDWRVIAERETELFRADMTSLNVIPPDEYVGAVESIPSVVRRVQTLRERGAVYPVDGDLYFSVRADPTFGDIAHLDEVSMRATFAERGGDPDRLGKRDPLDCLVWQAARPGEPAWESELGRGRPGWHIECVAIALDELGAGFDVQGGGRDLAFPHHEMGASEGHVLEGHPFARHYVHAGMVGWQGHKMSKSRGNLVFVSRLRAEGHDPMAIRLALLAHHYRADWAWTPHGLDGATARLALWREATALAAGPDAQPLVERMREHLADDLRTPETLDAVDAWARDALTTAGSDPAAPRLVADACDALLGVRLA